MFDLSSLVLFEVLPSQAAATGLFGGYGHERTSAAHAARVSIGSDAGAMDTLRMTSFERDSECSVTITVQFYFVVEQGHMRLMNDLHSKPRKRWDNTIHLNLWCFFPIFWRSLRTNHQDFFPVMGGQHSRKPLQDVPLQKPISSVPLMSVRKPIKDVAGMAI